MNSLSINNKKEIDLDNFYQIKKRDINQKNSTLINYISNNIGSQYFYLNPRKIGNNVFQNILLNDYKRKIIHCLFSKNEIFNNIKEKDVPFFQTTIQNIFSSPLVNKIDFTKPTIEKSFSSKLIVSHQKINHKKINKELNNNQILNFGNDNEQIITKQQNLISSLKIKFNTKIPPDNIISSIKKNSTVPLLENGIQKRITPFFKVKRISGQLKKDKKLTPKKRRRLMKNNKLVFIQLDQGGENDFENEDQLKEKEEIENNNFSYMTKYNESMNNGKKSRRSRFRGVSKNGNHWQVLIMVKKKKKYLGSYSSEEEAARIYDREALKFHGNKAKTNYLYSKEEIENIISKKC